MASYSHLAKKTAPVVNILNFVLNQLAKSIYRKLLFRQKYRDPIVCIGVSTSLKKPPSPFLPSPSPP